MNLTISSLLKKAALLSGILFLGWAAQAQTAGSSTSDTTRRHNMMHRRWDGNHGDSLAKRDGHQGYAFHRPGQEHFGRGGHMGHSRFGHRGQGGEMFVHYTPEQRRQVEAINKDYRQKSQDLFKQDNITLKQYKSGLIALQKDKKAKMAALLTPQQKDQIAQRRKRMTENAQVMEVAHLERLKLRLNLTDDQVAKIKAGQESLHNQMKAIHENDDLLPQQKMEQLKTLMAKRNDTYKSVLTPDQYTQYEQMTHRRFGPGGPMQGRHFGGPGGPGESM